LDDRLLIGDYGLNFPVEVNLEREGRSVENGAAGIAMPQVALDLAGNLSCKTSFQIFAN